MGTLGIQETRRFEGQYHSRGGSQLVGNTFRSDGGPIYVGSGSGMSDPKQSLRLHFKRVAHEV